MHPDDLPAVLGGAAPARRAEVLARLAGHLAPASDVTVPAARPWLRSWGPARMPAHAPLCDCASGRCAWCN